MIEYTNFQLYRAYSAGVIWKTRAIDNNYMSTYDFDFLYINMDLQKKVLRREMH